MDILWLKSFKSYLLLEKGYSENTAMAYVRDVKKFLNFIKNKHVDTPLLADKQHIEAFSDELGKTYSVNAQSRMLSGIKTFYKYLIHTNQIQTDPTELIEHPGQERHLPEILHVEEIEQMIQSVDLSKPEGHRNLAILEVLYGCGLRVSELCHLLISSVRWDEELLLIHGKGNKQRLVPVGKPALKSLHIWINEIRPLWKIQKGNEDYVFINRRGNKLSRVMVFYILKELAERAGIKKNIYPHILRHSFATHMVQGGADIRMVQEMLGHSSITTTEIYSHLDRSYLHETLLTYHPRNKK